MGLLDFAFDAVAAAIKGSDGSFLSIATDKPCYYAGEVVTGRVRAHIMAPKVVEQLVVKVAAREYSLWDEERAETIWEGEGEKRRSRVIYHHAEHAGKHRILTDVIVVCTFTHMLQAGVYDYPFSYVLRADLPGCVRWYKEEPARRAPGRTNRAAGRITYALKAKLRNGGRFSRDIMGGTEVVVNPFFDWARLQPARAEKSGTVLVCCCVPRGNVTVLALVDKSAYAAGETVQINATVKNESKK